MIKRTISFTENINFFFFSTRNEPGDTGWVFSVADIHEVIVKVRTNVDFSPRADPTNLRIMPFPVRILVLTFL